MSSKIKVHGGIRVGKLHRGTGCCQKRRGFRRWIVLGTNKGLGQVQCYSKPRPLKQKNKIWGYRQDTRLIFLGDSSYIWRSYKKGNKSKNFKGIGNASEGSKYFSKAIFFTPLRDNMYLGTLARVCLCEKWTLSLHYHMAAKDKI